MRRWLTLLLLVWLPLQFTWAVGASCCPPGARGSSHHMATHHMAAQDAAAPCHATDDTPPPHSGDAPHSNAPGMDCGHCHGYCLGMPDVPGTVALPTLADAPPVQIELPRTEHTPAQPERPQWPGLA